MSTAIRSLTVLPALREEVELHTADGLTLVGELARPVDSDGRPIAPAATLLTLHPLPTHGGYMDSHIIRKAAWRLPALAGLAVLRFNTRGTTSPRGTSQGAFDGGVGERFDVAAAIEFAEYKDLPHPTRVYAADCLALVERAAGGLHAFSHVTGGGLAANLARVLPAGLVGGVARDSWTVPPVFGLVRDLGGVPPRDLEATLNLGVGMVAVVAPESADGVLAHAAELGLPAWVLGEVRDDAPGQNTSDLVTGTKGVHGGAVHLTGAYRFG